MKTVFITLHLKAPFCAILLSSLLITHVQHLHAQSVPLGKIAYSVPGSPYQIWILDTITQTKSIVPTTGVTPIVVRPNWTPDGKWIVFSGGGGLHSQIWTVHPDGTGLRRITDGSGDLVEPTLSPDGSHIAFDSVGGNAFVINFDGTGKTDLGKNINNLSWSPDGSLLLGSDWAAGGGYNSDLWTYNFATSTWTKLTSRPSGTAYTWSAWNPSGTMIVAQFSTNNQRDIVKMNADGTSMVNLTADWNSNEDTPYWTSDGQYILFSSNHSGSYDIWAMKPDGTGRINLTKTPSLDEQFPTIAETPCGLIQQLMDEINGSELYKMNKHPLIASLQAACASFDRQNYVAGINQLRAFQNKVAAQVGKPNPVLAHEWIRAAQDIIEMMGGSGMRPNLQKKQGAMHIEFKGLNSKAYKVQASTDLINWKTIGSAQSLGGGVFGCDDTNGLPQRFYRVLEQ